MTCKCSGKCTTNNIKSIAKAETMCDCKTNHPTSMTAVHTDSYNTTGTYTIPSWNGNWPTNQGTYTIKYTTDTTSGCGCGGKKPVSKAEEEKADAPRAEEKPKDPKPVVDGEDAVGDLPAITPPPEPSVNGNVTDAPTTVPIPPVPQTDPLTATSDIMQEPEVNLEDANRLMALLEMLIGKSRVANTEMTLKQAVNGFRPSEGEERGLKLGYPQYPVGPTVQVVPHTDAATKPPASPEKDVNDAAKNPMYPAGSDRMRESPVGDETVGKRPSGFFQRSMEALSATLSKEHPPVHGGRQPKEVEIDPLEATRSAAAIAKPQTESGQNMQQLVTGRGELGVALSPLSGNQREKKTNQMLGGDVVQKPTDGRGAYGAMKMHTSNFNRTVEMLSKAGQREMEAHKVAAAISGYEYVRSCPSCFSLMKAHKNYEFYSMLLRKAITTGTIPVRALEPREENRFQKDVKLARHAVSTLNFNTAPDGKSPIGVVVKGWIPFTGERGSQGARNTETGDVRYGAEAQRLLAGGVGRDLGAAAAAESHGADPQAAMGTVADRATDQNRRDTQRRAITSTGIAPEQTPMTTQEVAGGWAAGEMFEEPKPAATGQFPSGAPITEPQPGGIPVENFEAPGAEQPQANPTQQASELLGGGSLGGYGEEELAAIEGELQDPMAWVGSLQDAYPDRDVEELLQEALAAVQQERTRQTTPQPTGGQL